MIYMCLKCAEKFFRATNVRFQHLLIVEIERRKEVIANPIETGSCCKWQGFDGVDKPYRVDRGQANGLKK